MLKCNDCNYKFEENQNESGFNFCPECASLDVEEIEINCAHCSMFVGAICTAPKCVYGKFDK